jgi:LPS sulfotransferase NodH
MPVSVAGPVDSYFVCGTPRTGSSLLLGLLESTGVAGHPQAYFREPDEPLWAGRWRVPRSADGGFGYADYVRAALAAGRTGNGVFGAKLMWGTLDEVLAKLGRVYPDLAGEDVRLLERVFGRTRFVYLRRADVVAQAVSWLHAEQTGTWFIGGNGEIGSSVGNGRAPSFDAGRIGQLIQVIGEHNAAWEAWFASSGVLPHRVSYEELDGYLAGVTRGILDFLRLDVPGERLLVPRHERQADELSGRWIERYRLETAQLRVIKAVVNALGAVGISAWLFGGWGLDARIGQITREHGDVEFWVERIDAERSKAVLAGAGATALATQPPAEACEFTWDGVDFSTAYFDRQPDGSFSQPQGRWSDWLFPPGSFGDEPGTLDGAPVLAMSVAGMLAMKEQFPRLRNGRPWRQKDIDDIKILRGLAAEAGAQP